MKQMASAKNKTVVIVLGPTAAGKTFVAIELAKEFKTEIISADSRHYFIASHSIQDNISAGRFEQYALQKVKEIFLAHNVAIIVGGTGLYIKAFCEGMDQVPEVPA